MRFLQNTPLGTRLSAEALAAIVPELEPISVDKGQHLIHQGDPGDSMYIVQHGRLEVIARDSAGQETVLNTLEPGRTVGEISLLTGERRTATVVAVEPSQLLRLTVQQFHVLEERFPEEMAQVTGRILERLQQAHLSSALYASRLLGDMEEHVLRDLEAELELQLLAGGQLVMEQGGESNALYIVISGRLRVVHDYATADERKLYEIGRGQTVGEMGLITGARRTATVCALRDTLVARLSRENFDRLLAKHPKAMMRQFAGKTIQMLEEEAKGARRTEIDVATFAIVPIHHPMEIRSFCRQLVAAFERVGPTIGLDQDMVETALARPGVGETMLDSPANISMVRWLGEQEIRHQFVVYLADVFYTNWTQRCLRQADHILLVGQADKSRDLSFVEEALKRARGFRSQSSLILLHSPDTDLPSNTASWLVNRRPEHVYHVRHDNPADYARLARLLTGRGIGVVMSGGGARGIAHLGAVRRLEELGIPIDAVGGSSAGGIVCCLQASGRSYDSLMKSMGETVTQNMKDYTLPVTAFMAGSKVTSLAKSFFGSDRQLEDLWIPCFLTTANLSTSRLMIHERGPIWKYIRGTSSVPGVFPPVMEKGEMLVDGGLINNLPTDVMSKRSDIGTVIALDVGGSPDPPYEEDPYEGSLDGWKVFWSRINPFGERIQVPTLGRVMMGVAMISNGASIAMTRELADFYARLDPGAIGLFEFKAFQKSAENGYRSATKIFAEWEQDEKFQALKKLVA
jgi:NTE family protein/lysophospholipid hydrolase